MPNGITPRYSQSLSDWFSSLSGYGYGGQPGEYDMTPEQLLSQWGRSQIPGSPGYYTYEGILPTYPGFKEQYGVQNYLLNLEKMSQATGTARGKLGRSIALTGEAPTHRFYKTGTEEGEKVRERKTIADVMKSVIEQENIGRAGAEWDLAGKVIGGRKGWERDVSSAYQRYKRSVTLPGCTDPSASNYDEMAVRDDGSCEYGDGISVSDISEQFDAIGDQWPFNMYTAEGLPIENWDASDWSSAIFSVGGWTAFTIACPPCAALASTLGVIGGLWNSGAGCYDENGNEVECAPICYGGQSYDAETNSCIDPPWIGDDGFGMSACWPDPPDCPDGTCSLEHIDNDCSNEIETYYPNPFN